MAFLLYWRWLQLDLSRVARSDVPLGNLFFYGTSPVLILHIIKHFGQVFLKYDFSFKFLFVNIQLQETQHGNQPYNTLNLLKTVAKSLHTCDRGLGSYV